MTFKKSQCVSIIIENYLADLLGLNKNHPKTLKNHAQNDTGYDSDDGNDILHTLQGQDDYSCYYCDSFKTNNKSEYEGHVIRQHGLGHPCYPSKPDLEKLGLKPQGKEWET
jgi:hypothetical protein